ncbi:MAG: hypothetical protein ACK42D_01750 [Candidatus Paceibacteria bacterium]
MSDEEIERRSRLRPDRNDAEENRRNIVLGRKNNPPEEEESFHTTINKEAEKKYGGPLYPQGDYGRAETRPTNIKVEKREYRGNKKKRKRIGLQNEESQTNNSGILAMIRKSATSKSNTFAEGEGEGAKEKVLDIFGSTVGRGLITSAHTWTLFIYFSFQIWLGIITVVALGLVFAIEHYIGGGITQAAFDAMMASIGVNWDFKLVFYLFWIITSAICYFQLFGVFIQAKALGLHPLGGNGGSVKTIRFLLCVLCYAFPFTNCIPFVNLLYIPSIQAYPR